MPQAPDDGRRETRGTFCCSVPQGLSDDLSGESQLVSTQAVPGVTGDLEWSHHRAEQLFWLSGVPNGHLPLDAHKEHE